MCNDERELHRVRFAIFGLTLSSSWANGHATPWRGLLKALMRMGHQVTFFERDVPYYRAHRAGEFLGILRGLGVVGEEAIAG